jgi:SAM-dependent methyltransferase
MPTNPDIFGLAFRDYLDGKKYEEILVKIDLFGDEKLPVSYFFRPYDEMPEWEKIVLDECHGRILDVGAGAGSHALYLQDKGLDIMAIDISSGGVECMKERGVKKAFEQDFFTLAHEKYDTILFLMNGAGMAQKLHQLQDMLEKAASLLADDGCIFIESTDLLYMYEDEDGYAMINLAGDYYGEVVYELEYRQWKGKPFPWLFVDYENLSYIAELAELDCEIFYQGETHNYVARLSHKKDEI